MTGFESKRQAAQDKMELADAYASAVAATPNMPTPLERKLAVERIERARNALEAALEQQAEPTCPDCKAAVLYECVACSSNNYPPKQQAEPVAYLCENAVGHKYFRWKKPSGTYKPIALYTIPPQRPWVGLTDEEMSDTVADMDVDFGDLLWKVVCLTKIIEAKLEKKNGY